MDGSKEREGGREREEGSGSGSDLSLANKLPSTHPPTVLLTFLSFLSCFSIRSRSHFSQPASRSSFAFHRQPPLKPRHSRRTRQAHEPFVSSLFFFLLRCQWGTPPVASTSQTYGTWLGHCSRKAGITITNGSLPTNLTTVRFASLPLSPRMLTLLLLLFLFVSSL